MFGLFFLMFLAIFGYFGYKEVTKMLQKYLNDRNEILKSKAVPPMTKDQFEGLMDSYWITWARRVGVLR